MENSLYRDEQRKAIAGVCAGLSDYFKVEPSVVRLIFVLAMILHGTGLLAYIVLWIVLPKKKFVPPVADYTMPPFGDFAMPPLDPGTFMPSKKSPSTAALVIGVVLIFFGGFFLLYNYDLIPDYNYCNLWPVVLIVIGLVFIFGSKKKKPDFELPKENPGTEPESTDNPEIV